MEYKEQVKDYLNRCNINLEIVKKNDGYEFTQLFSNFISSLIFIKENRKITTEPLSNYGLTCRVMSNTYETNFEENIKEFIRHLRNACCHYGIEIKSENGEISKVVFKDKHRYKKQECEFEMSVKEIENVYEFLKHCIE